MKEKIILPVGDNPDDELFAVRALQRIKTANEIAAVRGSRQPGVPDGSEAGVINELPPGNGKAQ